MYNTENAAKNQSKIKLEFPELWGRDVKNHKLPPLLQMPNAPIFYITLL